MNTTTLSKCVTELKKNEPNIQYVLGMLETIIEMSGQPLPTAGLAGEITYVQKPIQSQGILTTTKSDGEPIPEFLRAGGVGNLTS